MTQNGDAEFFAGQSREWGGSGREVPTQLMALGFMIYGWLRGGSRVSGRASDPVAFPKRSELAGSAVEAYFTFCRQVVKPALRQSIDCLKEC